VSSDTPTDKTAATKLIELPMRDPIVHFQPQLRVLVALSAFGNDDQITFPDCKNCCR
jgi:hypothetical protein